MIPDVKNVQEKRGARCFAIPFFVLDKNLSQVYKQYVEILVTMAVPLLLLLLLNLRIIYAIRFQTLRCIHFLSPMSCLSQNQLWKYGRQLTLLCLYSGHQTRRARGASSTSPTCSSPSSPSSSSATAPSSSSSSTRSLMSVPSLVSFKTG